MLKTLKITTAHCALAIIALVCASSAGAYFGEIVHTISRSPEPNRWWGGVCWKDGYIYEILVRCSFFRQRDPRSGATVATLDYDPPWDQPYGDGISWDSKRNCWWILDGKEGICRVPAGGGSVVSYFTSPHRSGVCYDPKIDRLWVTDQVNNRLMKYTAEGEREATINVGVAGAGGIVRVGDKFWVTITNTEDGDWPMVYELNLDGSTTGRYFTLPHEEGYFWCIGGITFDGRYLWVEGGPGNDIYQVDIEYGPAPTPIPGPEPTPPPVGGGSDIIDYNGDGMSDFAVFRPEKGLWAIAEYTRVYFGARTDYPVPADYNGDGKAEIAVFRPQYGLWRAYGLGQAYFGQAGDHPVPADYNGDGKAEVAVFRDDDGLWSIRGMGRFYFGKKGDMPIYADFNLDGTAEIGIFRPSNGMWAIKDYTTVYLGGVGDFPVPGDYLGKGYQQIAIFRPSTGLWASSSGGRVYFARGADYPQPADYNGDGRHSLTGFYNSEAGDWAIFMHGSFTFGEAGDLPVSARIYRTY